MFKKRMIQTVIIPACDQHEGHYYMKARVEWTCPKCGGPRGKIRKAFSYDGSLRLVCDGWTNPCGHIDYYCDVREEARTNGLNDGVDMGLLNPDDINDRYDPETWEIKPEKVGV